MATSPLFGWEEPDDTDLVKDGAAAIRTLGNAIDTSMGDLLGGTTGQVLSKNSNTNMDFTWVTSDDANAIQNTIVDAKGDLIAATAADTPARLAVGTNGQTLVANSSTATGLEWQTPASGGGMTLLSTTTLTGSNTVTISSISQSYNNLFVLAYGLTNASNNVYRTVEPNASSSIVTYFQTNATTTVSSDGNDAMYLQPIANQSTFNSADNVAGIWIYDYASTTNYKPWTISGSVVNTTHFPYLGGGSFKTTSAISSLEFISGNQNWTAGTVKIYGVK